MKRIRIWVPVLICSICILTAGAAVRADAADAPADLTLTVPMKITNLRPEVVSVFVFCNIYGGNDQDAKVKLAEVASPPVSPNNGAVDTTVTLEVRLDDKSKYGYLKFRYDCQLLLGDASKKAYPPNSHPWNSVEPGTASRVFVAGEFP